MSHRTLALLRWDVHFLGQRLRNALLRRDAVVRGRVARMHRPRFLNLGSGPRGLDAPEWINVDGFMDRHVHHVMDFGRPFPFADDTFDGIFCEHVMEHFDMEQGSAIFGECLRVLRPGGTIRVIVPDGAIILRAYFESPEILLSRRGVSSGCVMEAVNSYFRQRYEHQCIYDFALMRHVLTGVGFTSIRGTSYRQGSGPAPLLIDDPKYEWESLYVEADKPVSA